MAALRERAYQTELQLSQIRALIAAATGLRVEQITLDKIRDLMSKRDLTVQELRAFIYSMPRLMWVKRRESKGVFRMVQVSQYYADKYLAGPASDYSGKLDSEIWPAAVAEFFSKNDEAAHLTAGVIIYVEEPVESPLTGVEGRFIGSKWGFRIGDTSYVCGLGVHVDSNHETDQE